MQGATIAEDLQIKSIRCPHCDFSSGMRGMDRCAPCDGTGSQLRVGARYYPNTEAGYTKVLAQVRKEK